MTISFVARGLRKQAGAVFRPHLALTDSQTVSQTFLKSAFTSLSSTVAHFPAATKIVQLGLI